MPQKDLAHLEKRLNFDDEVSWYRLSRFQKSPGNVAQAQQAIARFEQLLQEDAIRERSDEMLFRPNEVTEQKLDFVDSALTRSPEAQPRCKEWETDSARLPVSFCLSCPCPAIAASHFVGDKLLFAVVVRDLS